MEGEEIHVLFDYSHVDRGAVFVERNEDRPPLVPGGINVAWAAYQRLGCPEAIDVCLRRVL